jgi:hypothetical protein
MAGVRDQPGLEGGGEDPLAIDLDALYAFARPV